MQYQDGHISTCFNEKILVIYIYCIYACASWSLFVIYLFVLAYSLLIVYLFCSLFDYLFCFHFHRFFAYLVFKREKNNSDPELCSGISIPLTEEVPVVPATCSSIQHHHFESINIIQQTPPTLS